MYKLVIRNNEYVFYKHYRNGYKEMCVTNTQNKLSDYIENDLPDTNKGVMQVMCEQVLEAIKDMMQLNNNVSEFGVRGYYTVSYHE